MGEVETFLSNHKRIKTVLDRSGEKGMCALREDLAKAGVKVSPTEMDLHLKVFNMHSYGIEALTGVYCSRDALTELYERLSTSTK